MSNRQASVVSATVVGLLAFALLVSGARAGESLGDLTGPWILFVDDHHLAAKDQVARTYHAFEKHPNNPVLIGDAPWEYEKVYLYGTVLPGENGQGYRMWYHGLPLGYEDQIYRLMYATSNDGLQWHKPNLGIVNWFGSTNNNIFINRTVRDHIPSIIHTPWDPDPNKRYRMINWDSIYHYYLAAYSPDGIHWTDSPANPLFRAGGDVGQFVWDPRTQRYLGYVKLSADGADGTPRRAVGFTNSTDFENWSQPTLILAPDAVDDRWVTSSEHSTHFYGMSAFAYESMYIGFLWIFRKTGFRFGYDDGPIFVELVTSHDGVNWLRQEGNRPPILDLAPFGNWDGGMIFTPNHPLVEGDTIRLHYGACDGYHAGPISEWKSAIGLATLRKDGFASLDAGTTTGTVLTKKLAGAQGTLHVNYRTTGGWLKAEVLDESGQVVPGYEEAACNPVQGDSIDQVVTWADRPELPVWPGPLRLRFILQNASLYSFQAGPALSVVEPPTITKHPVNCRMLAGGTARFGVEVVAQTPTTYQWQKDGLNLADGGHYAGVNTVTLVISPADRGDVASYRCVVTHPHGSAVSDSAKLELGTWAFTGIGVRAGASGSTINGLTSDGQIATGESGGQAIIWSTADGLKVLGLPDGATASSGVGVGLYEGNVVVAVDTNRSSYRAHRWDGNLAGAGTFSTLPRAAGSREWLVRSLGTDGAENLWIAGSTLAGGDGNGREACLYTKSAAATGASFVLPPNSHDHSDFNAVADNGYFAGQYQYGGTAPTGGARNAMKRGSGLGCTALNTIMGPPSTAYEAIAWAISHNGRVLGGGSHYMPGALFKPVIWKDSNIPTAIPFLPGGDQDNTGEVLALNGDGTLAGGYSYRSPSGVREAFIWEAVQGTRSLQQVLTTEYGQDLTGWTLQEVRSISSDQLVLAGIGLNNGRTEGWVVYFAPLPVIADFDADNDVDQEDFSHLQACLTGPTVPVAEPNCLDANLDGDSDVDQHDFLIFHGCMSGANIPADPACDD